MKELVERNGCYYYCCCYYYYYYYFCCLSVCFSVFLFLCLSVCVCVCLSDILFLPQALFPSFPP